MLSLIWAYFSVTATRQNVFLLLDPSLVLLQLLAKMLDQRRPFGMPLHYCIACLGLPFLGTDHLHGGLGHQLPCLYKLLRQAGLVGRLLETF